MVITLYFFLDEYGDSFDKQQGSEQNAKSKVIRNLKRPKRFHPTHLQFGCIKGSKCCSRIHCRIFCPLCYSHYGKQLMLVLD